MPPFTHRAVPCVVAAALLLGTACSDNDRIAQFEPVGSESDDARVDDVGDDDIDRVDDGDGDDDGGFGFQPPTIDPPTIGDVPTIGDIPTIGEIPTIEDIPTIDVPHIDVPTIDPPTALAPTVDRFDDDDRVYYVADADILFDFDEYDIRPDAESALDAILQDLEESSPDGPLVVEGHTDDVGSHEYNVGLSQRRAQSVAQWLMTNGIDADRIGTIGHSDDHPVASNSTAEGRQQNRRVVIIADR